MSTPTRADLEKLLWSDPASACFEADALKILDTAGIDNDGPIERVKQLIETVGSETSDTELIYEHDIEDLRDLQATALRGAILLLHAAFEAKESLDLLETPHKMSFI